MDNIQFLIDRKIDTDLTGHIHDRVLDVLYPNFYSLDATYDLMPFIKLKRDFATLATLGSTVKYVSLGDHNSGTKVGIHG